VDIDYNQFVLPPLGADVDEAALVEWVAQDRHEAARVRPPPLREGLISRSRVIDQLLASPRPRVVTIVAPAGFGKTTLMAMWRRRETRATAWLSLDRTDNDPAQLLAHVEAALRSAGMLGNASTRRVVSDKVISHGVPRIVQALKPHGTGGLLMLDNLESIHSRASNDVIAEMAAQVPTSVQLVVASRVKVRLPVSVMRTQGVLGELTAHELSMDREEAHALLQGSGVDEGHRLDDVMDLTEGWPAGLYLAGLAARSGSAYERSTSIVGGDRYFADYLRAEFLGHFSEARVAFLTRTAILERFCGPLCDAILATEGSTSVIEKLEESNLLIVPLDRTRSWYRYHHLLAEFLLSELRRREPDVEAALHLKAARWFDAHEMHEQAIDHAFAADDFDLAAHIIGRVMRKTYALGRADTVFDWLRRVEHVKRIGEYPALAATGALTFALAGDEASADRWAGQLDLDAVQAADDLPEPAWILRALRAPDGIAQVRADARAARRREHTDPDWLAAALELEGFSYLWEGDLDRADALFAKAVATGEWFSGLPAASIALAARAVVEIARGNWETARTFSDRSLAVIVDNHLEQYLTSGLTFALAARCAVRRGEVREARRLLAAAAGIRPKLTTATRAISIQTLLEMATAHVELGDVAGGRLILHEMSDIVATSGDIGLLSHRFSELRARLTGEPFTTVGALVLTSAELRLLPYLTTHLSFPEIGERLYVSRHTVKTQAMSIYRKFGASSRSEAVRRATELGLLTT
jgi:LuxR family transcriptional regulator, maltose regulon positive regulatory protein